MSLPTILSLVIGTLLFLIAFEIGRITWYLTSTRRVVNVAQRYEQPNPHATQRVLFVGDSIGCSTGASHARYSLAGRIGADLPEAHIENRSEGKMRLAKALRVLEHIDATFDVVIIQIGGMDLVSGTPMYSVRRRLHEVLRGAKQHGHAVLLIGPNNPGLAPLYRFPISSLYHARARKFDRLYEEVAYMHGAHYASLFEERAEPSAARTLFAPDKTHPNSDGYGVWYNKIKTRLTSALNQHDGHSTIDPQQRLQR